MKKFTPVFALICLAANAVFAQTPLKISVQDFATGFSKPLDIVSAGDSRLFIAQQGGLIRIIDSIGQVLPDPFLNLVDISNDGTNEQGLLGLVFHPNYAQNGFFYVNYSNNTGVGHTQVSRFSVDPTNPNLAVKASEVKLLTVNQPFWNHNGGCLKFGPDGYLYIGMGDGGSGNDPGNRAQNGLELLGKMLRIDVDNGSPYAIPADNPFVNDPAFKPEIWTMGMRNPWRFSFDRLTGDMWIGDVGQNAREEIDFIPAGQGGLNMGWRCREGFNQTSLGCTSTATFTDPVFDYPNPSKGCSVTGGYVWRGAAYPSWQGVYWFADYCSGRFWAIQKDTAGVFKGTEIANLTDYEFSTFGENNKGQVFAANHSSGKISRLCSPFTLTTAAQNVSCTGGSNGAISMIINDLQGIPSVKWSNGSIEKDLANVAAGSYTVTVTDPNQCTAKKTVTVATQPPLAINLTLTGFELSFNAAGVLSQFQWYLNGVAIPGANSATYTATETGNYSLGGVDANGCPTISAQLLVQVSATDAPGELQNLKISPNPFEKNLLVEFELASRQSFSVKITDAAGQQVFEKKAKSDRFSKNIDLGRQAAGNYFLTIELASGRIVRQLVKL